MHKFCFVVHPLSLEDVARYEPGAKGKGDAIMRKIMEWMPPWAAVHVTGVRTPDGRETEGWFVAAPLLPEQMIEFPREEVYERILRAIEIGAELGAQVAGLGAFTGVVGDGGVTINERSPIPVTTGNSLTIAAGVQSFFRGAHEMGIDPAGSHRGGRRRDRFDRQRVRASHRAESKTRHFGRAQRNAPAEIPRAHRRGDFRAKSSLYDRYFRGGAPRAAGADGDVVDARRHRARRFANRRGRVRAVAAARREPPGRTRASRRAGDRRRQHVGAGNAALRARARAAATIST